MKSNAIYTGSSWEENNEQNNIPTKKVGQKNILKISLKSKGHKSQPERASNGHS